MVLQPGAKSVSRVPELFWTGTDIFGLCCHSDIHYTEAENKVAKVSRWQKTPLEGHTNLYAKIPSILVGLLVAFLVTRMQVNPSIIPSNTIDSTTTMASNLAVSTRELSQNIVNSKLKGDQELTDSPQMTRQPIPHPIPSLLWSLASSLRKSLSCSPKPSRLCAERPQGPGVGELGSSLWCAWTKSHV